MNAPHVNLDVFRGDPLEYQDFMSVFDESVDSNLFNDQQILTPLLQYTGGPAKAAIKKLCIGSWHQGLPASEEYFTHSFWQ